MRYNIDKSKLHVCNKEKNLNCTFGNLHKCGFCGEKSILIASPRKASRKRGFSTKCSAFAEREVSFGREVRFAHEVCLRHDTGGTLNFTCRKAAYFTASACEPLHLRQRRKLHRKDTIMQESKLRDQSLDFAVSIINLVKRRGFFN